MADNKVDLLSLFTKGLWTKRRGAPPLEIIAPFQVEVTQEGEEPKSGSGVLIEINQYRTRPNVRFRLTTQGKAFDLTDRVINFVIGDKYRGLVFVRRPCTIVGSPKEGRCEFAWELSDTELAQTGLNGELELVLPSGDSQTLAQMRVNILPGLGGG